MNVRCIADTKSSLGFKLAGIVTEEVSTPEDAVAAFARAASDETIGIVLVTSNAVALAGEQGERYFFQSATPCFVEIPSQGAETSSDMITRLLKKTVGMGA